MAGDISPPTSFSARRRWGIFFSVLISMAAVIGLVLMANYLGARYFVRMNWSAGMKMQLSPQSLGLVKSITNDVKVVLYYDRTEPLYSYISALFDEYRLANPKISVRTVDYQRDAAAAAQLLATYKQYLGGGRTNFVIFDYNGKTKAVPGQAFGDYSLEMKISDQGREFRQRLKGFLGERLVSAVLLNLTSDKPFKAYYLQGHGEHRLDSGDDDGYMKFKDVLAINNVVTTNLANLYGTNKVPADCSLLVIAGPVFRIEPEELEKIKNYFDEGGRVFALFDTRTPNHDTRENRNTGLESLLAGWGVAVGGDIVRDPENTTSGGMDLVVSTFNTNHPLVNSMLASRLRMIQPRSVAAITNANASSGIKVAELAWTGDKAYIGTNLAGHPVPLIATVERTSAKGAVTDRGVTRMVITGDSLFLDNQIIVLDENQDFAQNAINWLLDQTQVMQGVGPHPIQEYTINMTKAQMRAIGWIFLGAMPGAVLLVGIFVWLRRRH